jgi:hypothetical protein
MKIIEKQGRRPMSQEVRKILGLRASIRERRKLLA